MKWNMIDVRKKHITRLFATTISDLLGINVLDLFSSVVADKAHFQRIQFFKIYKIPEKTEKLKSADDKKLFLERETTAKRVALVL